jgi:ribosomal protein S18 acetylase RimI-like enzyme
MTNKKDINRQDVQIGLAKPEERPGIWELYQRTYLDTYVDEKAGITRKQLVSFLATDQSWFPKNWQKDLTTPSKKRIVYVARHEGKIIGMIAPVFVDGKHRITALYVAPEVQHTGIGTRLMEAALAHHGNVDVYIGIGAHVYEETHLFYEPFGFKAINPSRRKTYPPDPMSYIEMTRPAPTR